MMTLVIRQVLVGTLETMSLELLSEILRLTRHEAFKLGAFL